MISQSFLHLADSDTALGCKDLGILVTISGFVVQLSYWEMIWKIKKTVNSNTLQNIKHTESNVQPQLPNN